MCFQVPRSCVARATGLPWTPAHVQCITGCWSLRSFSPPSLQGGGSEGREELLLGPNSHLRIANPTAGVAFPHLRTALCPLHHEASSPNAKRAGVPQKNLQAGWSCLRGRTTHTERGCPPVLQTPPPPLLADKAGFNHLCHLENLPRIWQGPSTVHEGDGYLELAMQRSQV